MIDLQDTAFPVTLHGVRWVLRPLTSAERDQLPHLDFSERPAWALERALLGWQDYYLAEFVRGDYGGAKRDSLQFLPWGWRLDLLELVRSGPEQDGGG